MKKQIWSLICLCFFIIGMMGCHKSIEANKNSVKAGKELTIVVAENELGDAD